MVRAKKRKKKHSKKRPKEERLWTIMLYLAGDNNLSDEMVWALKEIYRVGTGNSCHIVAQFDPHSPNYDPRRYDIGKLEETVGATADVDGIIDYGLLTDAREDIVISEDSSDPAVLGGFLDWSFTNFPADHYMLILSGHGSGAGGYFLQDSNPDANLTIKQFGEVLKNRRKIDILGLDCCAMSTAELAGQVFGRVDFIVGAEGFTHNAGWPYHRLLEVMRNKPSPADLAKEAAKRYYLYYSDYLVADFSADQSVIDLRKRRRRKHDEYKDPWTWFITKLGELSNELKNAFENDNSAVINAVILAHWSAQSFEFEQNTDVFDFCFQLKKYLDDISAIAAICKGSTAEITKRAKRKELKQLKKCLNDASRIADICTEITNDAKWKRLVPLSLWSGPEYQHAHGISIYFPWCEVAAGYDKLKFGRGNESWGKFLHTYINKTCRGRRRGMGSTKTLLIKYLDKGRSKNKIIGVGGWPVYRTYGMNEETFDGLEGVRSGGTDSVRSGGTDVVRSGGTDVVRTIARLCSMKNPPAGFNQPYIEESISNDAELKAACQEAQTQWLLDKLRTSSLECLEKAINGLSDDEKQKIKDILCT